MSCGKKWKYKHEIIPNMKYGPGIKVSEIFWDYLVRRHLNRGDSEKRVQRLWEHYVKYADYWPGMKR